MPTPRAAAIEALTGAGAGALAGGAMSGLSQSLEDAPRVEDEHGFVYSRPLTDEEKSAKRSQMLRAALIGAALGGTGSVLAGFIRRETLRGQELDGLLQTEKDYLEGLNHIVSELYEEAGAKHVGGRPWPSVLDRTVKANELLHQQQQAIRSDAVEAAKARNDRPWGGLRLTGGGPTPVPHEELTAEGRTARRFRTMQKEQGLPPLHGPNDTHVGEHFFRALLEKKSSAGLVEELEKISLQAPATNLRLLSLADILRGLRSVTPPGSAEKREN